jgi:phosphatidylserine synthase
MPTPANALFALGLWIWLGRWEQWDWIVEMNADQRFTLTLVLISTLVLSAYWLNSSLTILSFKPTNNNIRRIAQAMIVLLFCVLVIFVGPLAFTITVALLPVISFAAGQLSKRKFN